MQVICGDITKLEPLKEPIALTLGNFDGLHLGHQSLIHRLNELAKEQGFKSAVISFSPHPEKLLQGDKFDVLQTVDEKIKRMSSLDIDFCVVQDFSSDFAAREPKDFLRQTLLRFFNLKLLLFGYDYHFGHKGRGDFQLAQKVLSHDNLKLLQAGIFKLGNEVVSSSKIRKLFKLGDVKEANKLLGYSYKITGKIMRGESLGRQLGFPTANMSEVPTLVPGHGVYSGFAIVNTKRYPAVVNIGIRPTVNNKKNTTVECHIIGFSEDIYDQSIEFEFHEKVRDEQAFKNIDELKYQIAQDIKRTIDNLGQ